MDTAGAVLTTLRAHASADEQVKIRRHFPHDDPVIGVRMKTTFDTAKSSVSMPLNEVDALLIRPEYEARLCGVCILDFKARSARITENTRHELYTKYLQRHDGINSWDMVDRAAPRVIGRFLLDKPRDPLFTLARSSNPYERRTAITAPLYWARYGTADQVGDLFALAEVLLSDTDPLVSKPVGITLKYAGLLDPPALTKFMTTHGAWMQRATLRYATEKPTAR
ncbi:DNA alkylation repair protein [Nocardia sp. NPDC005978]|uniref:DNA alkylation repair protein n=1 Tax=Nocardia sp. NPDC005978 TaxID=3156725 RepID=UPI0033B28CC2